MRADFLILGDPFIKRAGALSLGLRPAIAAPIFQLARDLWQPFQGSVGPS